MEAPTLEMTSKPTRPPMRPMPPTAAITVGSSTLPMLTASALAWLARSWSWFSVVAARAAYSSWMDVAAAALSAESCKACFVMRLSGSALGAGWSSL